MAEFYFAPIPIRYDGRDATSHQIDLGLLGISMQGASKLLGVAGHFALTGQYVRKKPSLSVKVYVKEKEAKCFKIIAYVSAVQPILPFFSEHAKITEYIINYILAKFGGRKSDMDKAMDVIETAIKKNGSTARSTIEAMRATVETLANGQRPAARMFVSPVGETCSTLQIGSIENNPLIVDAAIKDAIDADADNYA